MESSVKLRVVTFKRFESLVKKSVLHDHKLDVSLVAGTTEGCGLFGIEAGSFSEIEAAILLKSLSYILNSNDFIFLFILYSQL